MTNRIEVWLAENETAGCLEAYEAEIEAAPGRDQRDANAMGLSRAEWLEARAQLRTE